MKKFGVILFIFFIAGCGRWKTTRLKPHPLCSIGTGSSIGSVVQKYNDGVLDISFKAEVHGDNIYIVDNISKRLQVFNRNCEPVLVIGDAKSNIVENKDVKFAKFQFSIIDAVADDSSGNIYVQNSFTSSQKIRKQISGREIGFSISYILVFDSKGTLLYTLGKTGSPDIPFTAIESLMVDKNDRLFVISKNYDTWSVLRFVNKKRSLSVNFSDKDFEDKEGKETFTGKIENIIADQSGNELFLSVAFYQSTDFKYRKIFHYSLGKRNKMILSFTIPDPKNELFALYNDNVYLWDVEDKEVRYMICNLDGDIMNNISIKFNNENYYFNDIMIDESGNFYTYHANKKGLEVIEWR